MAKARPFVDDGLSVARRYDRWYDTARGRQMAEAEESMLDDLLSGFADAASLLDVGCGTGHFSRWFASQGLRVVGLDPSPAMLAVAAERGEGPSYVRGAAESLPFTDDAFDVVAFVTSLEFVADTAAALREARRVGRLGMFLGVLNAASPLGLRRKVEARFRPSPYATARFHTTHGLAGLLRREMGANARIVALRTALWPEWVPQPLRRLPFGALVGAAVAFAPAEDRNDVLGTTALKGRNLG
jgi:ubiquinone/menaquinone biosynthesis C-methylase UbiE